MAAEMQSCNRPIDRNRCIHQYPFNLMGNGESVRGVVTKKSLKYYYVSQGICT